jgi:hypothetical protein
LIKSSPRNLAEKNVWKNNNSEYVTIGIGWTTFAAVAMEIKKGDF